MGAPPCQHIHDGVCIAKVDTLDLIQVAASIYVY